ncbi:hypothetical protein [Pseudooceanicola sp. 200-1SW]|uniref:hypothetical protein n=1 Tax=Pseudooceanicola sp. 200-1SW TaxID=3425949 RepID=UPI003D7F5E21
MLRYLTLCATLAALLLTALAPLQARATSGCASSPGISDEVVCLAPGLTSAPRAPAKSPCLTCALPGATALPARPTGLAALRFVYDVVATPGRALRPDRRPPRA